MALIDLITLEEYKEQNSIVTTNKDDVISALIPRVSALVKAYCSRSFVDYVSALTPYTQYFTNPDTSEFLDEFPLISLVSLESSIDNGQTYAPMTAYTDYVISNSTDQLVFLTTPPTGVNCVKVVYTAGYADVPEDLKLAVGDLITYYLKTESTPKRTIGYVNVEYTMSADMPSHIKRVLELYRKI